MSTTLPNDAQRVIEARLEPMTLDDLDAVLAVEKRAYDHPWQRNNFIDILFSGYQAQLLMAGDTLLGYYIAMNGVDEVHLLNIAVDPDYRGQGWARIMLDALALWARKQRAEWVWLEVRVSNLRAKGVYLAHGYNQVGQRKGYYPAANGQREDAIVMSLKL